jgi:class 3 adenylate cyclase
MGHVAEPQIQFAQTSDGVNIAYYSMGEGPALVSVSSILWSHLRRQWPFQEYHRRGRGLGRGLRVIRYDSRGTGLSGRSSLDFSMEARLRDLEAVLDRVKVDRFALFGSGHGAPTAITCAALHPERVSHLILWCPIVRGADFLSRPGPRGYQSLREVAEEDWDRYTLISASNVVGFREPAIAQSLAILFRESMTPEAMRAFYASLEEIDATQQLLRVKVPTLVMSGEAQGRDADILPAWSKEIAAGIPNARLVTLRPFDVRQLWDDVQTQLVQEFLGTAEQPATQAPAQEAAPELEVADAGGLRIILFSDVESNTELLQKLGDDRWRVLLREHERITRGQFVAHGGDEIKGTGDGFIASFSSAARAIECAMAIQRAMAGSSAFAETPLRVRIGLNAGEPIAEDGDLFGTAVSTASRIMDQGNGGEILVSDVVRQLVAGKNFPFSDRGTVTLRGFDDPVRIYELRWRGSRSLE